jgi:hypothetical protein
MGAFRRVSVIAAVAAVGMTATTAASAVVGGTPAARDFVTRIEIGAGASQRACTGVLVAPQWVATARACFATADRLPALGTPTEVAKVTVGATTTHVAWLAPHADRDVLLAKLAVPVAVPPVPLATGAVAAGESVEVAGRGRTATDWVPAGVHAADFTVGEAGAATLTLDPAGDGAVCKGDAGGPTLRRTAGGGVELVGLHHSAPQIGCLGEPAEGSRTATDTRVDDLAGWIRSTVADVQIYGVRPDGRLTYSTIDSATGDRQTTVTSEASLGYVPKAVAALNANTLLITSPAGRLQRVDILSNNPVLTFGAPVDLGGGWVHHLLSYDGHGKLFGIYTDGNQKNWLRRYAVTTAKPSRPVHLFANTLIDEGFGLKQLAATGPDWILGATASGALRSYRIPPAGGWEGRTVATNATWAELTHLVSPGAGLYYGRTPAGGLLRFKDANPFDLNGADIQSFASDPVDTAGWDVTAMAAVPFDSQPPNPADVSIFGVTDDGHLTYSTIDSASGDRQTTVTSEATLGFVPRALAALNYNTLLVTNPNNRLYRVDVRTTTPVLTFAPPVDLDYGGWSHRVLAADGQGSLYGIAGSVLHRYTLAGDKPTKAAITNNTVVRDGFTITTLAAPAPGWILGTTAQGELVSYRIPANVADWERHSLAAGGWTPKHLVSPGGGLYYARTTAGALQRYLDANPTNGSGTDITAYPNDPVDSSGWNQILLSAVPWVS